MARKPGQKQKEKPAGCAGESEQRKRNIGEEESTVDSAKFESCDEIAKRMCEEKRVGGKEERDGRKKGRDGMGSEVCGSSKFLNS